jgi:flagellar basal-body rod protein FlgG
MRALYAAATGMAAQQTRLDSIANNLANVQTTGYKKSRESFQDLMYQELSHGGLGASSARIEVGSGVRLAAVDKDFSVGSITQTGRPLDVAIEGPGFFEIMGPAGERLFTRDGSFRMDMNGQIVTASGLSVSGLSIPMGAEGIRIDEIGQVHAQWADGRESMMGQIPIVDFLNPAGLRSLGGNLFQMSPTSGQPRPVVPGQDQVAVRQYFLEGSNVDVAEELVGMILTQRAYELNSKAVQAADETLRTVANLRRG